MQIILSDDLQVADVNGRQLKVGGPISFKNSSGLIVPGIILEFRYVSPKKFGRDAPWCYAKDLKSNDSNWFALVNWQAMQSEEPPAPVIEKAPAPPIANNELSDDDCL